MATEDQDKRMHIVLYQPEIPHNTGAVGRTCLAVDAKLWLVRPLGFRVDVKSLRRAGLDYWQYLDWEVVDTWEELRSKLAGHSFWYFSKRGKRILWEADFCRGDVLVFGPETSGLPELITDQEPDRVLRIPIASPVRSLNLSCSVAVAAFESARQLA
ncbi:MAG TPA: tRNA (cytidine(34)-2'-O)-methyltransferase [Pirellulaceae bacterium]|nr:tRNA (cytidine(34)-2'-O)-methyltransferase [Pirellulaceae bacterium]